jgi:hypothetical protein
LLCGTNHFSVRVNGWVSTQGIRKEGTVKSSVTNRLMAVGFVVIGLAFAAAGIYIGETDDAPGAAALGILLMIGSVVLGVRAARRKA